MSARRFFVGLVLSVFCLAPATPALGLANRVFVSQRSGNNANSCDNILTPCQTFAGAVLQLNPGGEAIVLDSGGYGPVTITQSLTIEAPPGVLAFIHPPSGDAITVNAGSGIVTLRGLVLNGGTGNGITVNSVGTLSVENCNITGFSTSGIQMNSAGRLNVKGTDVKACDVGVFLLNTTGVVQASIDHCHLDGNVAGFQSQTTSPGIATTAATYSTANGNVFGWVCGNNSTGIDLLSLEFCTGSANDLDGLLANGSNPQSVTTFSNCVFANDGFYGVNNQSSGSVISRGNNTATSPNPTIGTIGFISSI